ncbi:MAG: efflux transporter outer membrane subunit [Deltaproteobacteria bacterium]|nr:efflux transporter outer membrane subunit [Deltaproteobacteria bacterium]
MNKGRPSTIVRRAGLLVPLILSLSACPLGPNYRRPEVSAPAVYRDQSSPAPQASLADLPWWDLFKDETLKGLVETSLTSNYDLAAAVARVEQARQVQAQAMAQYFPAINYLSITSYGHNQFISSPSSNMPGAQGFLLGIVAATWEADVWGRIRRTNEAARAPYLATEEARRGVMLTLASDVSQAYFELLGLRLQLEIARETTQTYTATLQLFRERSQGGLGNALQTSRAASDLAMAAASIPDLERLAALKENQISILIGKNPGPIETKLKLLEETVPLEVPAGLPSALLERRPDVLSAEQRLRAANAQIGVAMAAYFPQIGLTTFFGKLSTPLSILSSGMTNAWSIGVSVAGPIFQAGAIRAQNRQAVAAWQEARAEYEQTALNAFRDVSDALIAREKFDTARFERTRAVLFAQEAVDLSLMRYTYGLSSYNEVLEAQQRLFPAQLALAESEINRRVVIVQLYKALGGGWNLPDVQWTAANSAVGIRTP